MKNFDRHAICLAYYWFSTINADPKTRENIEARLNKIGFKTSSWANNPEDYQWLYGDNDFATNALDCYHSLVEYGY